MSDDTLNHENSHNSTVLIVEDDDSLRNALVETVQLAGYKTIEANNGKKALSLMNAEVVDLVISDVRMDGLDGYALLQKVQRQACETPVILITAYGAIEDAVLAMRSGAVDYISKPFDPELLIQKIKQYLPDEDMDKPVAEDPSSKALLSLAMRVASKDVTVMISGESGTGKEVLARYIHDHSSRNEEEFVAINCAAIPENMLEATLFGYEKGSFTGAYKSTPGKFEQAQNGTILLDEISEMPLSLQAKLLRVLQEREVERLGGRQIIPLDVRVLATTNCDMHEEVKEGRFREDLFYRLNVFPLHWIPLRDRPQDILPMANYILMSYVKGTGKPIPVFSKEAEKALLKYEWPGNAREMDNIIQRALVLYTGDIVDLEDLNIEFHVAKGRASSAGKKTKSASNSKKTSLNEDAQSHEFEQILKALKQHNGNRKSAAEELGISERTLRYKLAKMRKAGQEVDELVRMA